MKKTLNKDLCLQSEYFVYKPIALSLKNSPRLGDVYLSMVPLGDYGSQEEDWKMKRETGIRG